MKKPGRSNGAPAPKNVGSAVGGVTVLPSAVITAISCAPHARVSRVLECCSATLRRVLGISVEGACTAYYTIRTWLTTSTTKPLPAHSATSGADASIVACARSYGLMISMSGTYAVHMHVDPLDGC